MREILEGAAAGLAALHASRPEIDALADLEAAYESCDDNPPALARLNRQFHNAIFTAARNRFLDDALQELQDAIALLGPTTFHVEGRVEGARSEHRAILSAIGAHQAEAAEAAARAHIREALRARLRLMQSVARQA
jgi:DNA-binding FadR family transcriptional regulator